MVKSKYQKYKECKRENDKNEKQQLETLDLITREIDSFLSTFKTQTNH